MPDNPLLIIENLQGGRNGFDPPHSILPTQTVEAFNVELQGSATLTKRRGGAVTVAQTGGTALANIYGISKFMPGETDATAEMWVEGLTGAFASLFKRAAASATWADVAGSTLVTVGLANTLSLNGLFYIAAPMASGLSRIAVYDPTLSSPQIRYVGLKTPAAAPTVANTGAGAYAAVLRYYRVRWIQLSGAITMRRSEPSASVSFTPSGAGTAARVTQPTVASELETHWEVEASTDNVFFYRLAQVAIATTTYDDSAATTAYSSNTISADIGEYTTFTSARFITTDQNRLIAAGTHLPLMAGEKTARVQFSAVLGSTDQGDLERVPNNTIHSNFVDLNEKDGGGITGMSNPIQGIIYVFKKRQIWKLIPTGDDITPYLPRLITSAVGSLNQNSIVTARDEVGNPALYFWNEDGPYRLIHTFEGATIQFLGEDLRDFATKFSEVAPILTIPNALYYSAKQQVWFHVQTNSNGAISRFVFHIAKAVKLEGDRVRGGWTIHAIDVDTKTATSNTARGALLYATSLATPSVGPFVPYTIDNFNTNIYRCDTTDTTDNGISYQAYIKTAPLNIMPFGENVGVGVSHLLADPLTGATITLSLIRDYGLETRTSSVSLTAAASETKVIRKFEDADMSGAGTVQAQIGDSAAVAIGQWKLHILALTIFDQEPR